MALVLTNGHQGMRFSDDEEGEVQSGSATGFSDVEPYSEAGTTRRVTRLTDPVTQILDKIDAELSSLTRSQGSTATTATDSTVVHKPDGRSSVESSVMENGESLSMSQLGMSFKPSMMSSRSGTSDHDTGIGTSSIQDHSIQHRSLEPDIRPLEPGDSYRCESPRMKSPTRQVTTPNIFLNGQHLSDDDKQRQENQSTAPYEAKQVDDKFKEILQKRKGILKHPTRHKSPAPSCDPFDLRYTGKGGMVRMSADDDAQTIRTEDFVDKFQDTMVYSSADEAERIRNLDDDLHSDGGSDTDTLQRKLAILTRTPVPKSRTNKDGRTSPRPLTRPMIERAKGKFASPYEMRPKRVPGPGTPPVYPKPTQTTSLPRPSTRSTLKFAPGHASDADSVKTEDFENKFKEMAAMKEESDLESVSNDPIHTRVKQLLKATAKYKPSKTEYKPKHHVRISPQPAQYDKGEESDDTLTSEKQRVASPRRSWSCWESAQSGWSSYSDTYNGLGFHNTSFQRQISKSSSFEDSSKSSCSLSLSSFSSGEKEKNSGQGRGQLTGQGHGLQTPFTDTNGPIYFDKAFMVRDLPIPVSQISVDSSLPSWNGSDLPLTSTSASASTSSTGSVYDDGSSFAVGIGNNIKHDVNFSEYMYTECAGPTRRRSLSGDNSINPYSPKKIIKDDSMTHAKEKFRQRDLIAQEEEEDYPFAKYTFNKKSEKNRKTDDSSSSVTSSMSNRSSSQESIFSVGLMKQFTALKSTKIHQPINKQSSSSSMLSSLASSFTDFNSSSLSMEDSMSSQDYEGLSFDRKNKMHRMSQQNSNPNLFLKIPTPAERQPAPVNNPYNYQMYNFPQVPVPNPEQMLNNMGFNEARSILPDRFLKSWIEKALVTQQEEYMRSLVSMSQTSVSQPPYCNNPYYVDDSDLPPSVSAQQSGASTPQYLHSMENIHGMGPFFPDSLTRKSTRRPLQRSASFNQSSQSSSRCDFEDDDTDLEKVGALPLKKENSFDKLKRILQTSVTNKYRGKGYRRSMFASNHQNSLPIFLETLSEEEDESRKQIKTPGTEPSSMKSKMRSFLEEEERLSSGHLSSSDNGSDISKRDNCESVCSCVFSDSDVENGFFNFDGINENDIKTPTHITIPSIIVSEKKDVISDSGSNEKVEEELERLTFNEETVHVNFTGPITSESAYYRRPLSPNPDNQSSKNCSEVADIFGKNDRKIMSTSKTAKVGGNTKGNEMDVSEWPNTKPDQFLRLTVSDSDDKYLSPSSSIASPNIMSPITVIEAHKLDNQNDSLDADEQKQNESKASRRNSVETTKSVNLSERLKQRGGSRRESGSELDDKTRKGKKKHQAPKCLTLKRHFNGSSDLENQDLSSGCDNVFHEKCNGNDASIQTDDNTLVPILHVSEVNKLMAQLFKMVPAILGVSPYYLAHDRAVQCNLIMNSSVLSANEPLENEMEKNSPNVAALISNKDEMTGSTDGAVTFNVSCQTLENDSSNNLNSFGVIHALTSSGKVKDITENASTCVRYDCTNNCLIKETMGEHNVYQVPANGPAFSSATVTKTSAISNFTHNVLAKASNISNFAHNVVPLPDDKDFCKRQIEDFVEKLELSNHIDQAMESTDFVDEIIGANRNATEQDVKYEPEVIEYVGNEFEYFGGEKDEGNSEVEEKMDEMHENFGNVLMRNTYKESTETADDSGSVSATGTVLRCGYPSLDSSTSFKKSISMVDSDKASLTDLTEEDLDVNITQSEDKLRELSDGLNSGDDKHISDAQNITVKSETKVMVGLNENGWSQNPSPTHVSMCCLVQNFRSELTVKLNHEKTDYVVSEPSKLEKELPKYVELGESNSNDIVLSKTTNLETELPNCVGLVGSNEVDCILNEPNRLETGLPNVKLGESNGIDCILTESTKLESKFRNSDEMNDDNDIDKTVSKKEHGHSDQCHSEYSVNLKCEPIEKIENTREVIHGLDTSHSYNFVNFDYSDKKTLQERLKTELFGGNYEDKHKITRTVSQDLKRGFDNKKSEEIEKNFMGSENKTFEGIGKKLMGSKYKDKQNDSRTVAHDLSRDKSTTRSDDIKQGTDRTVFRDSEQGTDQTKFRDSGIMSEDSVHHSKKSDILRKFQELVNVFEDGNATPESAEPIQNETEPNDFKSQVISTRSLDFETIGSRKGILQRCVQTGFAKSFDFWGLDAKLNDKNSPMRFSETPEQDGVVDENFSFKEDIFLEDLNEPDDIYGSKDISYQVGIKYNKDNECYDVYGRIKRTKEDDDDVHDVVDGHNELKADDNLDEFKHIITEGCINEVEDDIFNEILDNSEKLFKNQIPTIEIHKDTEGNNENGIVEIGSPRKIESDRKQVFDMFEQVDHDHLEDENEEFNDHMDDEIKEFNRVPSGLTPHMDYSVSDDEMRDTLDEIERLYTMSINDEPGYLEEYSVAKAMVENEELELKYLESYQNKFNATETHVCKNCGHHVTVPVSSSIGATIEHDYCCECSPLNLTADMLEKRRLDRMLKIDSSYD